MALTAGARGVRKDTRNRTLAERWQRQSKDNSAMTEAAPTTTNRTLPRRQPIAAYRQREYLTESEVQRLIGAARKRSRNSSRDAAAILLAYRHGLRAQETMSVALVPSRSAQRSPARQSNKRASIARS